jgi:hypothetical protein
MHTPNESIWVPPSFGYKAEGAVRKAVKEYDPNLDFGKNERTGQWCIFLRQGTTAATNQNDLPILGFDEVPHPDDALRRLHQSDALRTGHEIQQKMERHNASLNRERELRADEATAETAEAFDWGFRQQGKAPHAKIFIPGKD